MHTRAGMYIRKSSCGYCKKDTGSNLYGMEVCGMSVDEYQQLIDRGFRRSGSFLYKPDLKNSCCPQYTIRLDVLKFKASKEQRQTLNRFNRGIASDGARKQSNKKGGKHNEFDLLSTVKSPEKNGALRVEIVPAEYTDEKYQLFKLYQMAVHNEKEEEVSVKGFKRFLCTNVFTDDARTSSTDGARHQMYYHNDKLIAIGVLDVLPNCVSSVYLIWHPDYARHGMGKIAALREIVLARELGKPYYYMGYYIHDCIKMKYKLHYKPSFILEPQFTESRDGPYPVWHSADLYTERLDSARYVSLVNENGDGGSDMGKQETGGGKDDAKEENDHEMEVEEEDDDDDDEPTGNLLTSGMPGILSAKQLRDCIDLSRIAIRVKGPMNMKLEVSLDDIGEQYKPAVKHLLEEFSAAVGPLALESILDLS